MGATKKVNVNVLNNNAGEVLADSKEEQNREPISLGEIRDSG